MLELILLMQIELPNKIKGIEKIKDPLKVLQGSIKEKEGKVLVLYFVCEFITHKEVQFLADYL